MRAAGPRLFVAVTPADAVRADLAAAVAPLRDLPGAPRWIPPERWHLTLLFLGTVPEERVARLREALGAAVDGTPVMTLRFAGGGWFGSRRRPQVAWAGVDGDVAQLGDLAVGLSRAARHLQLPVEDRPFRAHLTLGRWRPGAPADADVVERLAGYRGPDWPVTAVQLLQSHLGPTPRYDVVDTWPVD